jgi:4'-phosphopantetheinyl transferase
MQLSHDAVDIWIVDLLASSEAVERDYALLSDDERGHADRFRFPRDRRRFVIARAALRRILAAYMETDAQHIAFEYSAYGKPKLAASENDIRFNTSHSHEKALVACSRGREVGIDIEWIRQDLEVDNLSDRFFSTGENEKLSAIPPDRRHLAFLRCWTCKEAYVKAVGKGLSLDLKSFDVSVALRDPAEWSSGIEKFAVNEWSMLVLKPEVENYIAALVVEQGEVNARVHSWLSSLD